MPSNIEIVEQVQAAMPGEFANFDWSGPAAAELRSRLETLAHPDFRFIPVATALLEHEPAPGLDGWLEIMRDWSRMWQSWTREIADITEAGEDVLFLSTLQVFRTPESESAIEFHSGEIWTFREGKLLIVDVYNDVGEAREAAGLREPNAR